jgi:serine/threonine protein kinase
VWGVLFGCSEKSLVWPEIIAGMSPPDDRDRTVIKPGAGATAGLGTITGKGPHATAGLLDEHQDALPVGTRLREFEVLSIIGQGGFGIVYLAYDQSLDRQVALKEYMPSAMAARSKHLSVAVRSARDRDTFAAGLRSFVNEARLLARFDHPALLKVHQFWEDQGTAYMVMPYYSGLTLKQRLKQSSNAPDEAQLRAWLGPLLDALATMHAADCFHRDIAPDNILILPDERPLLLDFGAARHVIADRTHAPTVILKNGYAPVEQYGEDPEMLQGAWTDLYALGSVVQYAITGRTPPQAVARFLSDKREPLAQTAAGHYSDVFLRAIDKTLAVLPKDRPQSVAELRALLGDTPAPVAAAPAAWLEPTPRHAAPTTAATMAPNTGSVTAHSENPAVRLLVKPSTSGATTTAEAQARKGVVAGLAWPVWAVAVLGLCGLLLAVYVSLGRPPPPPTDRAEPVLVPPTPNLVPKLETPAPAAQTAPAPTSPPVLPADPPATVPEVMVVPAAPPEAVPAPVTTAAPAPAPRPVSPAAPPVRPGPKQAPVPKTKPPEAKPLEAYPAPRATNKKLPNARCDDIIARVSLGEDISAAEKSFMTRECKQ